MQTKTIVAIIASMDDFLTFDELMECYLLGDELMLEDRGVGVYEAEIPVGLDPSIETQIGRGLFFQDSWSSDDTFSIVMDKVVSPQRVSDPEKGKVYQFEKPH